MNISRIVDGYIDAIEFTEVHCDNPEIMDSDGFAQEAYEHADRAVRDLVQAFGHTLLDCTGASPQQIGHDLWLTRNGHGAGFWDREDLYGPITSEHLTAYAEAIGERYAWLGEDNLIYID